MSLLEGPQRFACLPNHSAHKIMGRENGLRRKTANSFKNTSDRIIVIDPWSGRVLGQSVFTTGDKEEERLRRSFLFSPFPGSNK